MQLADGTGSAGENLPSGQVNKTSIYFPDLQNADYIKRIWLLVINRPGWEKVLATNKQSPSKLIVSASNRNQKHLKDGLNIHTSNNAKKLMSL